MTTVVAFPRIIQGGMGVAVSDWKLARAVSLIGQLGVISGTALDTVLVRRLQDGDLGGHMQRAMRHFPIAGVADEVLKRYFQSGGRRADQPYKLIPMHKQRESVGRQQLTMLANFVEVYLAKEGHAGPVGINLLAKVEMPTSLRCTAQCWPEWTTSSWEPVSRARFRVCSTRLPNIARPLFASTWSGSRRGIRNALV